MFGEDWRGAGAACLIKCLDELVNGDRIDSPAELMESLINIAPALGVTVKATLTHGDGATKELPEPSTYQDF